MRPIRIALAACSVAALAAPALASIPGNMEERAREGLLHVCVDTEPGHDEYVVCSAQVFDASEPLQQPYTAEECDAAGIPVDPADLDPCAIDFIPKVKITGRLLLVHDEFAFDGGGEFSQSEAAIVLELKKGGKKASFVELFDGTKIGNWNGFGESLLPSGGGIDYTNEPDNNIFQFSNDNLTDLGLEIRELAAGWFPKADLSGAVAVLTLIQRDPKRPPLDHSAVDDTLASAATFKIVIQFARVRP